jgi:hypothetical protein
MLCGVYQEDEVDGSLGTVGTVKLTTVGTHTPQFSETRVTRADAPKILEYNWGGNDIRWELELFGGGTRLTLGTTSIAARSRGAPRAGTSASTSLSGSSRVSRLDASSAPKP